MPGKLSPQEFVYKWRQATLKESSAYQEHFIDICRMTGHPSPAEADPTGQSFTFQAGADKQKGGPGWADVWKKGFFAWEYKGKHANLDKAYQQLLQYREALLNPPLLVVSDLDSIVVHTNFTNTVKQIYTLTFDDLLKPEGLARLRAVFYEPDVFKAPQTTEQVTQAAAKEFARLAELLRKYGEEPPKVAHFLIRLLFCLFAEDIELLPRGIFSRLVSQTRKNSAAFAAQLRQLFAAMSTGGYFGADEIAYFNGGLFDDDFVLELDSEGLEVLVKASSLDWSSIEPSILGTLFERSLDPAKRAPLGAHYTSKEDIMLIVEPVLMAPLRRRWAEMQAQARDLAARRDSTKNASTRTRLHNELSGLLLGFAQELSAVQVLDPACGSGNFLYVALRQLLDLEKEVVTLAGDLAVGRFFPSVSPSQLHGIEVNPYAHELAQATIWIGYIQWLRENGFGQPGVPILKPIETVKLMDAILVYDDQGRPVEPEWPEADVIVGNPPFLGMRRAGASGFSTTYAKAIQNLYRGRVPGDADLVCYWFERARALIEVGKIKRAGLLATQAIRGGSNQRVLERIQETGDIFWAQSDRDWILDGAMVHVSMIGFDDGSTVEKYLDGKKEDKINSDLTSGVDLTKAKRLPENFDLAFLGFAKGGPFDISEDLAQKMLRDKGNPNRRPNSDVLKRLINGIDVLQHSRKVWVIDFTNLTLEEAAQYSMPFEYVRNNVKPAREKNPQAEPRTRENWWLFRRPGTDMRAAIAGKRRYIVTVLVSKHKIFSFLDADMLPDGALGVFARDDDYFFGVLHSKSHQLWARRKGTQLREAESGQRYTPTSTFETFPFPWPPGREPAGDFRVEAIAKAARELVEKRDNWLNPPGASEAELKKRTLTNLYNQSPTWLKLAHEKLDRAVLDAYGWPYDLSDEEILSRLLALNLERAGK